MERNPFFLQLQAQWDAMYGQVQRAPSPIPDDPVHGPQRTPPPPPAIFRPPNRHRHCHRSATDNSQDEPMRKQRRLNYQNGVGEEQGGSNSEAGPSGEQNYQSDDRRPLQPTDFAGYVEVSPQSVQSMKEISTSGGFYAKSQTKYLGPFESMPTAEQLPVNDNFLIIQKMGQHRDTKKSIFIRVGTILT